MKLKSTNSSMTPPGFLCHSNKKQMKAKDSLKHFVIQRFKDKDFSNCDMRHNGYVEMRFNNKELMEKDIKQPEEKTKEEAKTTFKNVNLLRFDIFRSRSQLKKQLLGSKSNIKS
jgi:hypothetical protein